MGAYLPHACIMNTSIFVYHVLFERQGKVGNFAKRKKKFKTSLQEKKSPLYCFQVFFGSQRVLNLYLERKQILAPSPWTQVVLYNLALDKLLNTTQMIMQCTTVTKTFFFSNFLLKNLFLHKKCIMW